ncbi:SDR family NAD(P)-dependent oxidoreductase [Archangium minus]|uniref:SDR family NAD(P)-dependent oxidoreductase n=1 Tax=Archangium minus TaxID=83450 RepID=A0ABY9X0U0_9BACT|nr:SDR family NAD(P)-dependent oxidoreductase [Archangium violaceum]WNG49012.1 SDR family NAD(P)-dependent oxidoreductase [Archangium minus]
MDKKVVVITGASAGIGAALAEQVGRKGWQVVLAARREPELRQVAARVGPEALPVVADVSKREDVQRVMEAALARFGQVDVWVNNAGRGISKLVSELTDEDFDEMMRVNVKSALYGIQAVLPHFQSRGSGHIINVSSVLGRVPHVPQRSAYNAAKHALNALTANLRQELRERFPGIHVTTFLPGVVATEFGVNALGGGVDSRQIPGAQSVEETASVLLGVIERPRPDVYSRPEYRQQVIAYYSSEDLLIPGR